MLIVAYAPSENSDQPAHSRRLSRVSTGHYICSQGSKASSGWQRRLWSDCADAQADQSSLGARAIRLYWSSYATRKQFWLASTECMLFHSASISRQRMRSGNEFCATWIQLMCPGNKRLTYCHIHSKRHVWVANSVAPDLRLHCFPFPQHFWVFTKNNTLYAPSHEKRYLIVFRFVVLQMRMSSPLLGLQTCLFAWSFLKVSTTCLRTAKGSGETALMRSLAWAFAGRLCDKYPF